MLSKIKEDEGKINEAADILQELQVEYASFFMNLYIPVIQ
jgi:hypothetical protein